MKPLLHGFLALLTAGLALAAPPAAARFSGRIVSEGGGPPRLAQVRVEGPALAGRENSQVIQRAGPDGTFQVSLPPGTYDVWATAPDHEESTFRLEIAAGSAVNREVRLPVLRRTHTASRPWPCRG